MDDRKKHELWGKILKFCQGKNPTLVFMLNRVLDALKKEVADAAEKKKQVLSERIVPLPNLSGMSKSFVSFVECNGINLSSRKLLYTYYIWLATLFTVT